MVLTGIHILLTYMCSYECEHCFVYSGPYAKGTFTLRQIREVIDEAAKINTVQSIYFEGGEPFLFYPLMIEGIRIARSSGFRVGVVTNAYYAMAEEDAELWFRPLYDLGISDLSISDDVFHHGGVEDNPSCRAMAAARKLGLPLRSISVEEPVVSTDANTGPVVGGGVMFRGRAVDKLAEGLPKKDWEAFTECPHEDLEDPKRIHVDAFGNVLICQGLSIGNMWETPLSVVVNNYIADVHPVAGPIAGGGPALLVKKYDIEHDDNYVDACHLCHRARLSLADRFPEYITPRQVYGLE